MQKDREEQFKTQTEVIVKKLKEHIKKEKERVGAIKQEMETVTTERDNL